MLAAALGTALLAAGVAYWFMRPKKASPDEAISRTLAEADDDQRKMMEERCIIVNDADEPVRPATKAECHQWAKIGGEGAMVHRAFSVFLFDHDARLVLQQRSEAKITFPGYWANTCCSHPLWRPEEMELEDALGVKRAARRKLQQELGTDPETLPLSCFHWVGRVHYRAPCDDAIWGEHEIDHVLLALPEGKVPLLPNDNEVQATESFTEAELGEWLDEAPAKGTKVSPWFSVIREKMLPSWWAAVRGVRSAQARGEEVDVAAAMSKVRSEVILRAGDPTEATPVADAAAAGGSA
ncbi:hypothetical protein FNF29_01386 [Cafeteria roenbergensis]|uniref:isopentenyl-diphosphate Delta-isomerase n=1 Tax=Cafeteria roenbergensis TaxID=33653 RepID=A0A5A8CU06_CAFRO|nr:hypothetical protein FNF29_01386 [Cafeteria roenbergensis]|eukprot:KAA0155967.1 hypothetical protein FNF29_01386 [Cafeteria roenbergensis]